MRFPSLALRACAVLFLLGSSLPAADTGTITGTVGKGAGITSVQAVNRADDKDKTHKGTFDEKTGTFTIPDLPLGATYDVVLNKGDVRLEGVNLKVPPSDFEEEQPLTKDDRTAIIDIAKKLNKFENEIDVLVVSGNCQHAAVFLNKRRTTPFYESKPGEMIWRLELWHFQKPDDHWLKDPEELGVIFYRERLQKSAFEKKSLTLDPVLGGLSLTKDRRTVDLGRVTFPDGKPGIVLRPEKKAEK
jgi:hypothetical protein